MWKLCEKLNYWFYMFLNDFRNATEDNINENQQKHKSTVTYAMPTKQNNTKGMKGTARKCKEMNRYITESGHWDFQAGSNYVNTM